MKLVQLSIASIIACLLGLFALIGVSLSSLDRMHTKQAEVVEMLELQERVDDISAASDQFLLYRPDSSLWQAFRAEALRLRQLLREMGTDHPTALRAARHIEQILEMLAALRRDGERPSEYRPEVTSPGPVDVPLRSRVLMTELAGHGIALDTALDEVLRQRQSVIAREATWIAGGFAGAAMLFGVICILAFALIYRRIVGPARALTMAMEQPGSGDDGDNRMPIRGNDEFAELAHSFNRMLDRRRQAESRLHEYRALVEGSHSLYSIFDADYRYVLINRAYGAAYGFDPDNIAGRRVSDLFGEGYFRREIKPCIDRALAGEICEFEAERDYRDKGRRQVLIRYYPIANEDGRIERVGAIVTDVTELKQAEAELHEQARLLDMAGRVGRFGGWAIDLPPRRVEWSDVVAEIHGMPAGYSPTLEEGIEFYAPEFRERIRERFNDCAEHGTPYNEELQIVTANGERRWIRSVGVPVRDEEGHVIRVEGAFQDINARKESEREAGRLTERLRTTLESITDAFFTLDRDWRFNYVNAEAERILECDRDTLIGEVVWDKYPEAVGTRIEQEYRRAIDQGVTVALEEYYPPLAKWFDIRAYPSEEGLTVLFRDVTERREMIDRLREHERELEASHVRLTKVLETRQALINSLPAHIALLDAGGVIIDVNDQWRHFGRENDYADPDSGLGLDYLRICRDAHGDHAEEAAAAAEGLRTVLTGERESFALEYPCHSPDRCRWFRMMANRLNPEGEGESAGYGAVIMHIDITERKLAEQELERIATEDPVSGALTRHGFVEAFHQHTAAAGWDAAGMVLMLDIEGMRNINDAHGYEVGDQHLAQIVGRLHDRIGENGIVGRTGGDELAVFLPSRPDRSPEEQRQILDAVFEQPFRVKGLVIESGARFGYTLLGEHMRGPENLLREAELALFETRHHDGNEWAAYTADLDRATHERIEMTRELRVALEDRQFELHFQPKVELASGRLVGSEALLRWFHPQRGLQSPGTFIPIAEQSQLMAPIGDWVLQEACRCLREWQDAGLDIVRIAVNVSVIQFRLGHFVDKVREAIAANGIDPSGLTLEITESVFERESTMLRDQLRELHELGVRLSLDDFGTGYSSLLYLQQYPFDEIKIDQGFTQRILEDPYSRKIVTTVLGITGALGAEAVAEGIELPEIRDALLEMGCRFGQGFYYSMPLAVEDFRWLLDNKSVLPLQSGLQQQHGR